MKKHIILCLTFLLSACSLFNSYDKEFKNPIFYQPIQNTLYYSRGATEEIIIYTYLTDRGQRLAYLTKKQIVISLCMGL